MHVAPALACDGNAVLAAAALSDREDMPRDGGVGSSRGDSGSDGGARAELSSSRSDHEEEKDGAVGEARAFLARLESGTGDDAPPPVAGADDEAAARADAVAFQDSASCWSVSLVDPCCIEKTIALAAGWNRTCFVLLYDDEARSQALWSYWVAMCNGATCDHLFCHGCISRWVTEFTNSCPLCNAKVRANTCGKCS